MPDRDHQQGQFPARQAVFATTHWSVVLDAKEIDSPQGRFALERLGRAYWYPLYAFLRRKGYDSHSAEDLTQGFFLHLIGGNSLGRADRTKGRFRSWLLGAMRHFLAHEWEKAQALKRGGGNAPIPLDEAEANERYQRLLSYDTAPEKLYDQQWALTLLERAGTRLAASYVAQDQADLYDRLKVFVAVEGTPPSYGDVAVQLGMSESAVKSAIYRLRQSFHELVRQEVAQTVGTPAELDEEIRYLITVIRS
jgi:DNA-directed RNA polymerase specialized sigma24 family protein